jgi:hypothetical protein
LQLYLVELGLKPIVKKEGKEVHMKKRDLKANNVDHIVHEDLIIVLWNEGTKNAQRHRQLLSR